MSKPLEDTVDPAVDVNWLQRLPKIAIAIALIFVIGYIWAFGSLPVNERPEAWGQFGDYIGGLLNPLISLFTLIVAVSVWRLQKTELLETRNAVKEQGNTAEQQRREQRFFDLLNLYQETIKTVVVEGVSGKAALNIWPKLSHGASLCNNFVQFGFDEFNDALLRRPTTPAETQEALSTPGNSITYTKVQVTESWNGFSPLLDHYFRTIFRILYELSELLGVEHFRYGKLFRAQLSRDELTLLAFNLLFDAEGRKMRPLAEKYGLLKHLASSKLRDYAEAELDPRAFGLGWIKTQSNANPLGEPHAD
jgi:Putative phage abortive infection protein